MILLQTARLAVTREHAAILLPEYIDAIISGRKTVESRLSLNRREPFGTVSVGETLYFKARGGAYFARATIERVEFHEQLTPARVRAIRSRLNRAILGSTEYWQAKRSARYATLMWFGSVEPIAAAVPFVFRPRAAWASRPVSGGESAAGGLSANQ